MGPLLIPSLLGWVILAGLLLFARGIDWAIRIRRASGEGYTDTARLFTPGTMLVIGSALLLLGRRRIRYPIQAVIGALLVAGGSVWMAMGMVTEYWTMVVLMERLPWGVYLFVEDIGLHKPHFGALLLGVGLSGFLSATWKPRRLRRLVINDSVDDDGAEPAAAELDDPDVSEVE